MPLEQIRPSVQLYRSNKQVNFDRDEDHHAQQYDYGTEDYAEMHDNHEEYIESPRMENMNLLKLGGVGGVTRSGSWNRNLSSREPFKSLVKMKDDNHDKEEGDVFEQDQQESEEIMDSFGIQDGSLNRSQSGSQSGKNKRNLVEQTRSNSSSDVPSSSSRTSTSASSYSAAAFSLRSVSNRNSVSSTSSSGASSSRSPTAASEDESTATGSSRGKGQASLPSSSSTFTFTAKETALGVQLHPDMAMERAPEKDERAGVVVSGRLQDTGKGKTPSDLEVIEDQKYIDAEEKATRSCDWPGASPTKRIGQSPRTDSLPLKVTSPSLGTLTLSAAAASPASPDLTSDPSSAAAFVPPAPRRHTSTFALRSRSAFAQSGQPRGNFTGSGGGRAAARELARRADSSSYENAPFSELEARHEREYKNRLGNPSSNASSQSTSPNPPPHQNLPFTPPHTDFHFIAPTPHTADAVKKRDSTQYSPRKTDSILYSEGSNLGSPRLARRRELSNSSDFMGSNRSEASYSSSRKPSLRPSDVDIGAANALFSPQLLHSAPNASGFGISPNSAANASHRPSLVRDQSTTQVLRTPTTEEWSRFLAKQGVDPATIAAAGAMGRPRTNTGRSSKSQQPRRLFNDRMASLSSSPNPSSELAKAAAAGQSVQSNDDQILQDEEDDEDEEVLLSNLGRLGLSRISLTGKGIITGSDDLSMLHEDYEGEEDENSSSDERMRALHEAISRPPSRRGSPPILDSPDSPVNILELEWDKMVKSPILSAASSAKRRSKRPSREVAAILSGYTMAPPGERRKIDDFDIETDVGRGAYGLVKKAKLRDVMTGKGAGKDFIIKYIIKSRILADCWRRHKILGPIPIEIHVMDQLRRLPYNAPSILPPWSAEVLFDDSPASQERALSTIKENIGHPSLCKMLDFFEDHEFYYMVMPCFGKGQDLFDYIEAQPHGLSSMQVRCIFGQIADGLRFLHQSNIVHRDVKDENVILDGDGHAQIIDFGSAAHVNKNGRLFDTFSGTLDYAAAEILKGEKYGGKEQDVWALGVVGYVLLCGDCPFWNGEEAIQGLQLGTRAYDVLLERCCTTIIQSEKYEKRLVDQMGQADGGGKIDDGADLIQRCLELNIAMRPSMDIICQHRFLIGDKGWSGPMGWKREE